MLEKLRIQNIALIPRAEIEFGAGFNVLSGETGAGKSIVIGSINFILGDKVPKTIIRSGESFARVDAIFSGDDENLILTRILKADGKSECRINDEIVTTATLKSMASSLINIHGQHDTTTLLDAKSYVGMVDSFGRISLDEYSSEYVKMQELKKEIAQFGGNAEERQRTLDMLQFQIKEIEDADLKDGEDEQLQERKTYMQSFEKIKVALNNALVFDPATPFGKMNSALSGIGHLDTKIFEILERGKSIQYEVESFVQELSSYSEELEFDEDEFAKVDARLDKIKLLKRKYGATVADVLSFHDKAKLEYERLASAEEKLEKLRKQIEQQEQLVQQAGQKLTEARIAVAKKLEIAVVSELSQLAMEKARLEIRFSPITPSSNGCDALELWFSANVGEPLKPLNQTISGGEMSRFMLALKALQASGDIGTLVFDEVDTGIGGMVATNIAGKISQIAKGTQVIVVTHLAQIANVAAHHFLIKKVEDGGKTITTVKQLDASERKAEMLRMQGGMRNES